MDNKKCYSVVIPLFNKHDTVMRTVNSVLAQGHEVEIIVVDDGSTDDGAKTLSSSNIKNIKLISQSNKGVSSARNRGIKECSNDLIAFIDADDEWLPNYLDMIDNLVTIFPDAGAYATSFQYKYADRTVPKKNNVLLKHPFIGIPDFFKCIRNRELFCTSSIVVRKEVIEQIGGFDEGMWYAEDTDTWVRLALVSDIAYDSRVGINYYQDQAGRTMRLRKPVTRHLIDSVNEYIKVQPDINEDLLSFVNRHLCLVVLKNIGYGYPQEARALLSRRPSNKAMGFIAMCYLLSVIPSSISSIMMQIWDMIRTN